MKRLPVEAKPAVDLQGTQSSEHKKWKRLSCRGLINCFPSGPHVTMDISLPIWWLKWPWGITYGSMLGWMNIHLPPTLMFTRGTYFVTHSQIIAFLSGFQPHVLRIFGSTPPSLARRGMRPRRPDLLALQRTMTSRQCDAGGMRVCGDIGFL